MTCTVPADYKIGDITLERVSSFRDLGVTFDSRLTFVEHIDSCCAQAYKSLGFVLRVSRYFRDEATMKSLFSAYVLAKLEYGSLIWYPVYTCHSLALENIQRKFLKYLSFKTHGVYPEVRVCQQLLLSQHNMLSLLVRRRTYCAKFLSRMIRGIIDCPFLLSRVPFYVPRVSARHCRTFRLPPSRSNALVRCPISVMCNNADELIEDIFNF